MEFKAVPSYTDPSTIEGRTVPGIAAIIGNVDDGGDKIFPRAFRKTLKENTRRVRHLWQHDYNSPPVASIKELREIGQGDLPEALVSSHPEVKGGLLVVREYLETPRGEEILAGIKSGAINEMSFAFDPIKFDFEEDEEGTKLVRNLRELRLWDTSDVNWGMNPLTAGVKKAILYKDTGTVGEDTAWNVPNLGDFVDGLWEDLSDAEQKRIAAHYAYSVNWPPQSFSDLKLPHHLPVTSGIGKACWRGVGAAMGALLGAAGGVNIPSGGCKAVYNHLAQHYTQWDKDTPDYKMVELAQTILVSRDMDISWLGEKASKVIEALETLSGVLATAESPSDYKREMVLTETLIRRLSLASRDSILLSIGGHTR